VFLLRASNWPVEWPLAAVAVTAVLYLLGGRRSATSADAAKRWRGAAFYAGLASVALAVDSPVDAYSDRLFWVHMVQHVLLTAIAPPLLLLGRPWPRVSRPLPLGFRRPLARTVLVGGTLSPARRVARWLTAPVVALVLARGTLLAWHLPVLYDLTLRNALVHNLEHALFFGTAMLFWMHLVPGATARPRLSRGQCVAYGTAALLLGWVLAVVLAVSPDPLYSYYAALAHRPGGISALNDQQLAAGIMWVPGSIPYTIALFVASYRWLDPAAGYGRRRYLQPREAR